MIDRAMAQGHIDDLLRAAEHQRIVKRVRRARIGERGTLLRRVGSAVAAAVLWPIRH
jgi:hypothetical protein